MWKGVCDFLIKEKKKGVFEGIWLICKWWSWVNIGYNKLFGMCGKGKEKKCFWNRIVLFVWIVI